MKTTSKKRHKIHVATEPDTDTVPYSQYVDMKLQRNAFRKDRDFVVDKIVNASLWKRLKYLITGEL